MSLLSSLVDVAAGFLRQVFGGGPAAEPVGPQARGIAAEEVYGPPLAGGGGVAPAVPEAPAGAGPFPSDTVVERIMPSLSPAKLNLYLPYLASAMREFSIDTPLRTAAFLAQLAHESGELREWTENLDYSPQALLATFPTHFGSLAEAATYGRQPERIANRVYANRMGNGDEGSGDGWKYRGRGPIALTGHDNYQQCGIALGIDLVNDPDRAATPQAGFRVAGWFWSTRALNSWADIQDFEEVTRRINGGLNGLPSREAYYAKAREVLGV
jgi:putative chitinase